MASGQKRCVIVGAGIAGLTTALALHTFGIECLVLEKAARFDATGAGIQLSPNATSILSCLGIMETLSRTATRIASVDLYRAGDNMALLCLPTSAMASHDAPFLAVQRADLHSALMDKAMQCPSIELVFGASLAMPCDGTNVRYRCDGKASEMSCRCVIGADGVWSSLRTSNNGLAARYSGYVAFRNTVNAAGDTGQTLTDGQSVRAFVAPNAHLVAYPVAQGKLINLVFIAKYANAEGNIEPDIAGLAPTLQNALLTPEPWTRWPVHTVHSSATWILNDKTILIGDAAHAMLPFAAQGAAMAIEDGYCLAYCMAHNPDIPSAFAAYTMMRRNRVQKVAQRARLNAFAYHASGPVAFARNLVFAARGERLIRDLDWLYAYRAPGIS